MERRDLLIGVITVVVAVSLISIPVFLLLMEGQRYTPVLVLRGDDLEWYVGNMTLYYNDQPDNRYIFMINETIPQDNYFSMPCGRFFSANTVVDCTLTYTLHSGQIIGPIDFKSKDFGIIYWDSNRTIEWVRSFDELMQYYTYENNHVQT